MCCPTKGLPTRSTRKTKKSWLTSTRDCNAKKSVLLHSKISLLSPNLTNGRTIPLRSSFFRYHIDCIVLEFSFGDCLVHRRTTTKASSFCIAWPFKRPSDMVWVHRWVTRERSEQRFSFAPCLQVYSVKYRGHDYALKALRKNRICEGHEYEGVKNERDVLVLCRGQPFIIQLYAVFHDFDRVYFLLEYAPCGAFYDFLIRFGWKFNEQCIQWFSGQIVCALDYLHSQLIVSVNKLHRAKMC